MHVRIVGTCTCMLLVFMLLPMVQIFLMIKKTLICNLWSRVVRLGRGNFRKRDRERERSSKQKRRLLRRGGG